MVSAREARPLRAARVPRGWANLRRGAARHKSGVGGKGGDGDEDEDEDEDGGSVYCRDLAERLREAETEAPVRASALTAMSVSRPLIEPWQPPQIELNSA